MSYTKTLSTSKHTAIVEVTGWDRPALAISQAYLEEILKKLALVEEDMISSKSGVAGIEIHTVQQELSALLRGCSGYNKGI
ncbi:hypothetical protein [Shewanella sp. HN-41]|uniref:hypothetical protein n=1 Tax=Shewanella sp. HN-41 TaxID=327275 RepID=UPI000212681F|nr:hypothetical protein [Shewanella sp. HN-41]EGM70757.1 hypothetical protein SOHN41_01245 [Shewanella sp. HN-41]